VSTGEIDARDRAASWGRLTTGTFDVLVVGGGITGAGAALDAASRGLRVALVEARDLASGTSSRSSKLIHGGLRYLEQRDFKLVREALHERDLLVSRLAPHLVHPVPFLYPLYRKVVERPYVGAGLALYDAMEGPHRPVPFHRHLTTRGASRRAPALRTDGLAGAMTYYDAQVDDARYTMTVARTAAAHGALVMTRCSVESLRRYEGKVIGARVRDCETGRSADVTAARVVVCAGTWTPSVLGDVDPGYTVRMSKGVHIVVPRSAIDAETGMIIRTERSVLFFIPAGDRWIVGTTDTEWSGDPACVVADETDVSYLLTCANRVLARPLTRSDVLAVYAGLRPLVDSGASSTTKVSREHVVSTPLPGLVTIAGGKFTTYRLMARDAVDAAVADLGRDVPASVTGELPLLGADGLPGVRASTGRLAEDFNVPVSCVERLTGRYGSLTPTVLALGASPVDGSAVRDAGSPGGGSPGGRSPSVGSPGGRSPGGRSAGVGSPGVGSSDGALLLRGEVVYAVTHEGALHVEDVLARRSRLLITCPDHGVPAAPAVASVMGGLLGWGRRRRSAEVRAYEDLAATDNEALTAPESLSVG
jgi:glycerol-3-phosphate dehydrogenase